MRMFKLLFKSLLIIIISMIIITACSQPGTTTTVKEQNNGTTQNPENINALVNELKSRGFDTKDYSVIDGLIIVDGDIAFDIEELKKQISQETNSSSGPKKQFRDSYALDPNRTFGIKIYYGDVPQSWQVAIEAAMTEWYNTPTLVYFYKTTSSTDCDIMISMVGNSSYTPPQMTLAKFPDGYNPGKLIRLWYNTLTILNDSQKKNTMVHLLGHTIGMRNNSYVYDEDIVGNDKLFIPGTPTSNTDPSSVWSTDQYKSWTGFSGFDKIAITYLFSGSNPYIILYQNVNYGGQKFLVRGSLSTLWNNGYGFNDMASSVRVFNGARVTLYQDSDYGGGACRTITTDVPSLGNYDNFNDRASSVKVY